MVRDSVKVTEVAAGPQSQLGCPTWSPKWNLVGDSDAPRPHHQFEHRRSGSFGNWEIRSPTTMEHGGSNQELRILYCRISRLACLRYQVPVLMAPRMPRRRCGCQGEFWVRWILG
jgi:hypothetical protein